MGCVFTPIHLNSDFLAVYQYVAERDFAALDKLWQQYQANGITSELLDMVLYLAAMGDSVRTLNWLLNKDPDVAAWRSEAIWILAAHNSYCSDWFNCRTSLQTLALRNIHANTSLLQINVSFLLSLGPHPELETVLFRMAVTNANSKIIRLLISQRPACVRAFCLRDAGEILHRAPLKIKKCILQRLVLSCSDRVSIGLQRN
jgi:hypothetical protein